MSVIEEIFSRYDHRVHCHLWQLMVTENEYSRLKAELYNNELLPIRQDDESLKRGALLFFAETYRRLGLCTYAEIYAFLMGRRDDDIDENTAREFGRYAWQGAQSLGISPIRINQRNQRLRTMLYEGGLPLGGYFENDEANNGPWPRFIKKLSVGVKDFDILNLESARFSSSLSDFCDNVITSLSRKDRTLMKFDCLDNWYERLRTGYIIAQAEIRQINPFKIDWLIQHGGDRVIPYYRITCQNTINADYQNFQGDYVTLCVREESDSIDTFSYNVFNGKYHIHSAPKPQRRYRNLGETISISCYDRILISSSLDFDHPQLFFQKLMPDGVYYQKGNKLGAEPSLLLLPNNWTIKDNDLDIFVERPGEYTVFSIPRGIDHDIRIFESDTDEILEFKVNGESYETVIDAPRTQPPLIKENLYSPRDVHIRIRSLDGEIYAPHHVRYRTRGSNKDLSQPPIGLVYAQAQRNNGGEWAEQVVFLNIGQLKSDLITVVDSAEDSCKLRFDWPYGTVASPIATKDADDQTVWNINRNDITRDVPGNDPNGYVPFFLTPTGTTDTFKLTVRPPFLGFDIYDDFGVILQDGSEIPFADLSYYRYRIYGDGAIIRYQMPRDNGPGNDDRDIILEWDPENGDLVDNTTNRHIPFEGPLTLLFGDDQVITSCIDKRMLLDDHCYRDISNYPFEFRLLQGNNYRHTYTIRKFPYKECRNKDNNSIIVTKMLGDEAVEANIRSKLIAYPIDNPTQKIEIRCERDGSYPISPELKDAGPVIVTSSHKGYILPRFENYSNIEETKEERHTRHEETLNAIRDNLINDETEIYRCIQWFRIATKQEDTTDRYLGLKCLAEHPAMLVNFSYLLWCEIQDDEYEVDYLKDCLIKFSKELHFQWYWIYFTDREYKFNTFVETNEVEAFKNFLFDLYKSSLHGFVSQRNDITDEMITSLLSGEMITHSFVDLNQPALNILNDLKLNDKFGELSRHPSVVWQDLSLRRKIIYHSNYNNRELVCTIFQNQINQL